MREAKLHDVQNGNVLAIVVHNGRVYFEVTAKHGGTTVVASALSIDADIALLALRKLVA